MIGECIKLELHELELDDTEPKYAGFFRDACRLTGDPALIRRFKGCCVISKVKARFGVVEVVGAIRCYYKKNGNSNDLAPLFPTQYKNVLADLSCVEYHYK